MLDASIARIESDLADDALVLDVGGWAKPLHRADWVLDLMPYETRGLYGNGPDSSAERFNADTWICRDICDREPWPFHDNQFDFVACSHTLEDIRDPIFVCSELNRVARAGYVEVPSRLVEQALGVHGPWVGWSHHRWLVDRERDGLRFVAKPHLLQARIEAQFPPQFPATLSEEEKVVSLFWKDGFEYREHIFFDQDLDVYLVNFVRDHMDAELAPHPAPRRRRERLSDLLARRR